MPQVASETNAHLINHAYRPAQPDRAPGDTPASAFESMLDETARIASDRSRTSPGGDRASTERPETNRPPAESEPSKAAKADDAGHAEPGTADAGPPAGKPADTKSADGKAGETDHGGTNDPVVLTDASAEADAVEQVDVAAAAESSGEAETDGEDAEAGEEPAKTTGKQAKPGPDIVDDGEPGDGAVTDAGNTGTATAAKTAPAVAPTPTAGAHSENATHAADAAEGRTPPVAAAALQAAAGKPADAQAKGEENKGAPGELPPQSNAEDAPGRSGQKPALPEHVELPAQSHRNAPPDNAAMPSLNNAQAATKAAADATQPLAMTASLHQQPAQTPTATAAVPPQIAAQAAAVPLSGVAIEIASRALAGRNRFDIRLDPPELGRIEVRLDVDRDGRVTSHLVVDRKDTLSLLQRDAAGLQRALQDAGLKTADDGLQFSLRDQASGQQQERTDCGDAARLVVEDESMPTPETIAGTRFTGRDGGVDIRV